MNEKRNHGNHGYEGYRGVGELEHAILSSLSQANQFGVLHHSLSEGVVAGSVSGISADVAPDLVIQQEDLYVAIDVAVYRSRNIREIAAGRATRAERIRQQLPEGSLVVLVLSTLNVAPVEDLYEKYAEAEPDSRKLLLAASAAFRKQGFDAVVFLNRDVNHVVVVIKEEQRALHGLMSLPDAIQHAVRRRREISTKFDDKAKVVSSSSQEETVSTLRKKERDKTNRYLLVADEWSPAKGGISSFNVEFAKALREYGREVCVALPKKPAESELQEAEDLGIRIAVPATTIPGIQGPPAFLMGLRYLDGKRFQPTVVVGHGRILGPYAYALHKRYSSTSRVHIVHMQAEELERAKELFNGEPRTRTAADRTALEFELSKTADVVAGVGDKLTDWIKDQVLAEPLFHEKGGQAVCLLPGLRRWRTGQGEIPRERNFLIVARADDFELKGVETAIRAVGEAKNRRPNYAREIRLIIRGVPSAHGELKVKIDNIAAQYDDYRPLLREFSSNPHDIEHDLRTASAVLMPSMTEGFGLSAYEAIAAGVPVLVTKNSGLARLLRKVDGRQVWPNGVLSPHSVQPWVDAVLDVLDDPDSEFERARKLRDAIESKNFWRSSISELESALERSRNLKGKSSNVF